MANKKQWFLVDEFGGLSSIDATSRKDAVKKVGLGTKYDKRFWHIEKLEVEEVNYKGSSGLKGITKKKYWK